jgi:hypothetical protein
VKIANARTILIEIHSIANMEQYEQALEAIRNGMKFNVPDPQTLKVYAKCLMRTCGRFKAIQILFDLLRQYAGSIVCLLAQKVTLVSVDILI